MSGLSPFPEAIAAQLAPHGLELRGIVRFEGGEGGPLLRQGGMALSVMLIGHVGSAIWPAFTDWRARQSDSGGAHPLDRWSMEVIGPIAEASGATAYYPSEAPYQPFQRWAMMAEGLKASPLGILIHPLYGLWHGYRGALGFESVLAGREYPAAREHPCDGCREKPCLTHCPASAVTVDGFDVGACRRLLADKPAGEGCLRSGCLARSACPVGAAYRYSEDQLRFHMEALDLGKRA